MILQVYTNGLTQVKLYILELRFKTDMVNFLYKKIDLQVEVLDPIAEPFLPLLAKTDS